MDTATATVRYEHDLRPFFAGNEGTPGLAGGTYPFAVAVKGNEVAYVSSDRDREVVAIDISSRSSARLFWVLTSTPRSPTSMWPRTTRIKSRSSTPPATQW